MPSLINSDDGVVSGTSGLKTTGGNDGLLNIQTNGSTAISISSGQRSTFPTTIGVGNATPSTSGSGITFPATQSASSDANTLDDYEEGTWTPALTFSTTTSVTYNSRQGTYTKVGRLVTVTFTMNAASVSGSSGNATITGLPFTSTAQSCGTAGGDGTTFTGAYLFLIMDNGTNFVYLANQLGGTGSVGGWAYTDPGLWSAGGKYFNITYFAS